MRVGFVVGAFPEVSSTFILDQVTGLLELGHDVHVFARTPPRGAPVHGSFARHGLAQRTHYWWSSLGSPPATLPRVLRLLPRPQARRVLLRALDPRGPGADSLLGRWLSHSAAMLALPPFDVVLAQFGTNGRVALTLRELGAFTAPIATTWLGYDLSRVLQQRGTDHYASLFARSELMLPLSQHFRERLLSLGCPADKIQIHHVGVDTKQFAFAERALAPGQPVRILTVCRLVEKKGIEYALRALALLAARGLQFEYRIVGEGPLAGALHKLVRQLGLQAQVSLLGVKTREQVAQLLKESQLFLSPSVKAGDGDEEGVPAAIKEAMAVGMPVVSTFHAAIPEVVIDGVTGALAAERDVEQLADKLAQLIGAPGRWPAMGRAGRAVIEREYDLATLNRTLASTLEQLVLRHRKSERAALGRAAR